MLTEEGRSNRMLEKLDNNELPDFYSSTNTIIMTTSRRTGWARYVNRI
jgi:hypothetical protein